MMVAISGVLQSIFLALTICSLYRSCLCMSSNFYFSQDGALVLQFEPNDGSALYIPPFAVEWIGGSNSENSENSVATYYNGQLVNASVLPKFFLKFNKDMMPVYSVNLFSFDGNPRSINQKQIWPITAYFTSGSTLKVNCGKAALNDFQAASYLHNYSQMLHWKYPVSVANRVNITHKLNDKNSSDCFSLKTTLSIENLHQNDSGYYTCVEKTEQRGRIMPTINIIVVQSKKDIENFYRITNSGSEHFVHEGENFTFRAEVQLDISNISKKSFELMHESFLFKNRLKKNYILYCEGNLLDYSAKIFNCRVNITFLDLPLDFTQVRFINTTNISVVVQPKKLQAKLMISDVAEESLVRNHAEVPVHEIVSNFHMYRYMFLELKRQYFVYCTLYSPQLVAPIAHLQSRTHYQFSTSMLNISTYRESLSLLYTNMKDVPSSISEKTRFKSGVRAKLNATRPCVVALRCSITGSNASFDNETERLLTLTFTDIVDNDGGIFDIVEWNEQRSEPVTSLEERRKFRGYNFIGYEGDNIALACRVPKTFNDGKFVLQFPYVDKRMNIKSSTSSEVVRLDQGFLATYLLKLINLTLIGEYKYNCDLVYIDEEDSDNNIGKRRTASLTVIRPMAPYFEIEEDYPIKKMQAIYGKPINLICRPKGIPQPTIQWLKNGMLIPYAYDSINLTFLSIDVTDEGNYSCVAQTKFGTAQKDIVLSVTGAPIRSSTIVIAALIVVVLISLIGLSFTQFRSSNQKKQLIALKNELRASASYNIDFEIVREHFQVDLTNRLGEGEFGVVHKGTLKSSATAGALSARFVAIKVPKDGKNPLHQAALLDEMKIMMAIGRHLNVLRLIGACTCNMVKGELYVIIEFCSMGSLQAFLLNEKRSMTLLPNQNSDQYDSSEVKNESGYYFIKKIQSEKETNSSASLSPSSSSSAIPQERPASISNRMAHWSFSFQIANGMQYLGSKLLIHRDLAARNLLLTVQSDVIVVKIADYGLARQRSSYRALCRSDDDRMRMLPIGWMAPEALLQGHYTIKTDCWSFGVVLWEIFSLGDNPDSCYQEQFRDSEIDLGERYERQLADFLQRDRRLSKPSSCPDSIFQLMNDCWAMNPDTRPSFAQCSDRLQKEMEKLCSTEQQSQLGKIIAFIRSNGEVMAIESKNATASCDEEEIHSGDAIDSKGDFRLSRMNGITTA